MQFSVVRLSVDALLIELNKALSSGDYVLAFNLSGSLREELLREMEALSDVG